jgi:hypothetical protein
LPQAGPALHPCGMSRILINRYLADLDRTKRFSGSLTEEVIREAFKALLRDWARDRTLFLQVEYALQGPQKNTIKLDGAVLHELRVPLGYWEAKDPGDILDREIEKKLRKGYPQDNILFEDSATAVLIQNRIEVMRCAMTDVEALDQLLRLFFGYERPEIAEFRKAVAQFSTDLPDPGRAAPGHCHGLPRQRGFCGAGSAVPGPCQGHDQPEPDGRRCTGNADPAHPDRGNLYPGLQ